MKPFFAQGRVVRIALAASLAVNVFFVAFVGAQLWRSRTDLPSFVGDSAQTPGLAVAQRALQRAADALPASDRAALRQALMARIPVLREAQEQYLQAAEAARKEVSRTPIDPVALRSSIDAAVVARQKIAPIVGDLLADAILHMSDEGRQSLSTYRPKQ